jgi:Asp-tRNA(Asn)/Glu-tRNA(Gln) amidotransferase A subunit family amidase
LVSGILWKNAKFDKLKEIEELDGYEPRHDPTVIPIVSTLQSEAASVHDIPAPKPRADPRHHYTSADYVSSYRSGKLTPSSVAEAVIPLISNDAGSKHALAFLESKTELVREAARASTKRYGAGKPLGPLDGVPVAVKDEAELKGYKRTLGSRLDFKNAEDETAWCVRQWEEAGAIVIAKTNMHEIGLGR